MNSPLCVSGSLREMAMPCMRGLWSRMSSACMVFFLAACLVVDSGTLFAQDTALLERKQRELKEKEDSLKQKEERLSTLSKDLDEKIERYQKLLTQLEGLLKKIEQSKEERYGRLVKTYEAMPPEEAALRLAVLDEQTAALILWRMKEKKAAAVLACVEPQKAASLTETIVKIEKKFPAK